jgi:hypothetical protein
MPKSEKPFHASGRAFLILTPAGGLQCGNHTFRTGSETFFAHRLIFQIACYTAL